MSEKYNNLDIENSNSKDELHGYQERYNRYGRLLVRTNVSNNKIIGYHEYHGCNNQTTHYHIR